VRRWGPPYVRPWKQPGPAHPASEQRASVSIIVGLSAREVSLKKHPRRRKIFVPAKGRRTKVGLLKERRQQREENTKRKMKVSKLTWVFVMLSLGLVDAARRRVRSTTATTVTTTPASYVGRQSAFTGQNEGQCRLSGSELSSSTRDVPV